METFKRKSILPLDPSHYYSTASLLPDEKLIVYSYPYPRKNRPEDEGYMHHGVSGDCGRTWPEVKRTYFAKPIWHPQLSGTVGNCYFIHGRSESYRSNPRHLILYYSTDPLHRDEGRFLHRKIYPDGDTHTVNETT